MTNLTKAQFAWLLKRGMIKPCMFDDYVADWNAGDRCEPIHEFLGLTEEQYYRIMAEPSSLVEIVEEERTDDERIIDALYTALSVYADPGFYHGVSIIGDGPTGGFDEDYDSAHGDEDTAGFRCGSLARQTIHGIMGIQYPSQTYCEAKEEADALLNFFGSLSENSNLADSITRGLSMGITFEDFENHFGMRKDEVLEWQSDHRPPAPLMKKTLMRGFIEFVSMVYQERIRELEHWIEGDHVPTEGSDEPE